MKSTELPENGASECQSRTPNVEEYEAFVHSRLFPGSDLVCMGLGFAGETAEFLEALNDIAEEAVIHGGKVADQMKKLFCHKKALDFTKADAEAGDVLWYVVAYCLLRGKSLSDLMRENMEKLSIRYPKALNCGC